MDIRAREKVSQLNWTLNAVQSRARAGKERARTCDEGGDDGSGAEPHDVDPAAAAVGGRQPRGGSGKAEMPTTDR